MVESRKYKAYTNVEEWLPFFQAMQKILGKITTRTAKLELSSRENSQK